MPEPTIVERSVEKAHIWLDRILRAHLHALRDRLTVDETAQLAAQLPVSAGEIDDVRAQLSEDLLPILG